MPVFIAYKEIDGEIPAALGAQCCVDFRRAGRLGLRRRLGHALTHAGAAGPSGDDTGVRLPLPVRPAIRGSVDPRPGRFPARAAFQTAESEWSCLKSRGRVTM